MYEPHSLATFLRGLSRCARTCAYSSWRAYRCSRVLFSAKVSLVRPHAQLLLIGRKDFRVRGQRPPSASTAGVKPPSWMAYPERTWLGVPIFVLADDARSQQSGVAPV